MHVGPHLLVPTSAFSSCSFLPNLCFLSPLHLQVSLTSTASILTLSTPAWKKGCCNIAKVHLLLIQRLTSVLSIRLSATSTPAVDYFLPLSTMSQAMSPDPIWASMPIVKFSHLTSLYGKGYPPWAHVAADNLTLLIQTFRTCSENGGYDQRVMMKVLRGAEILVRWFRMSIPSGRPIDLACRKPKISADLRRPIGTPPPQQSWKQSRLWLAVRAWPCDTQSLMIVYGAVHVCLSVWVRCLRFL